MDFKFDQSKLEDAIVRQAVDQLLGNDDGIYDRISNEVRDRINKALSEKLNSAIEAAINSVMERALDSAIQPVNIWGEREGTATTIRAALHARAKDFWHEKVDSKGEKSTYGGKPRYEHVLSIIAAKEFESQIKANIINIAGAIKDSVREGFYSQVDEKLNEFFKIKSLGDQKKSAASPSAA